MSDDIELSTIIWERIKDHLPKEHKGWKIHSVNPRLRYCRYKKGHYFGGKKLLVSRLIPQLTATANGLLISSKALSLHLCYI